MILITGAGGKTGQAIIKAVNRQGETVRAFVRRSSYIETLSKLGVKDVVVGDIREQGSVEKAMANVDAVYHISPNMAPDEKAIGDLMIAVAREANVSRFVYHSVLHPQTQAMPHHWHKLAVEEALFESGLAYTILQPAAYMQNVLAHWAQIVEKGIYPIPYASETELGMVDLNDVAQVAALVLTESGHHGAIYELAGAEVLTQNQIAAILSQQLNRSVKTEVIPHTQWSQQAKIAGLSEYAIETLLKMFNYYEQFGFWGNANVLKWLLGREPITFAEFVGEVIKS